ncbi:Extracellular matrix-binding ebh, putative [Babesia ovata]|uniref:Extracellular matrix-binding ebh, putative n=1 Tax=Babesia ovata TaxID=189622 RepID=A0A2H6KIM0_9APIC|nr:Extracellular matrix-binding ebh, putative [Babesia ovata]GBE62829.1 Extracellular matrix-binding ebh, putative [Babesia ovata]
MSCHVFHGDSSSSHLPRPFCVPQLAPAYTQLAKVVPKSHASRQFTLNDVQNKPAAIGQAVQEIKAELKKLREKLKKEKGGPNDGVIDSLEDLKQHGLAQSAWNGKNVKGQTLSGLGKIHGDLQGQNTELGKQNKAIGEAIRDIRWQLLYLGFKVQNIFNDDDILDNLRRLKGRIGMKQNIGLEAIKNTIQQLQQKSFQQHPKTIGDAKQQIVDELTTLRGELHGKPGSDVITTLNDLQNSGLSATETWNVNSKNEKGLAKINSDLNNQQTALSNQPGEIGGGVQEITDELDSLRETLNTEVTDKLKKLKEHGLTDGNTPWTIDDKNLNGIQKITTDIIAIKDKDVDQVKDKLKELCTEIRTITREAKRDLEHVKKDRLEYELTGIKDQLHNLQIRLVSGPIQACREFINKDADRFARECIASLTAFVNGQVATAIDDITAFARQQYVSNIKEALEAFARKVEEELRELPNEISRDLYLGYKGLIKYMYGPLSSDFTGREESVPQLSSAFRELYEQVQTYLLGEIGREADEQNRKKNPALPPSEEPYNSKLNEVYDALTKLLTYLKDNDTFDHRLTELLRNLTDALSGVKPESFARPSSPVLDGLVEGLTKFTAEFTCAYVSRYAGAQFTDEEGEKCAKVFLTLLPTLCDAFNRLWEQCNKGGKWRDMKINATSKLGAFLQRSGYKVSTSATLQDGELRDDCIGHDVYVLVSQKIEETENNAHLKKCLSLQHACNLLGILKCLCTHLTEYYQTCHLKVHPSPRPPCSVYEMLVWCCGLTYNAVHLTVTHDALPSLFEADEQDSTDTGVSVTDLSSLALKAHPRDITPASLTDALTEVCHRSHSVLTTLLGYGHADGIYACDFNTNPGGLLYPGDADALLCLLFDVIKRLHHQLHFLYRRCLYNARHGGWLDCWYGRDVGGSSWKCNTMQCANQMCDQQCNQTHNQICNQRCDQHPKCGVKSPLQSFLEDGLVGFLPHQLSADGTCVKCSGCDTKSPGLPCKTPMGLANITRLASRAGQGRSIMDVLGAFCGGASSPLARLCGYLTCLLTRPPRTPDDLFAFYYNFICEWSDGVEHRKAAFEDAVGDACFRQRGVTLDVSTIFRTKEHGTLPDMPHLTGDLFSLVKCNGTPRSAPSHPCGPYLKPLGHDVRATFSKAHAHLYLSWVVYLTETFYDFLQELLRDCERNCADATSNCHARSCANDCTAKRRPLAPNSTHTAHCPSIVDCDSTTPTLFRYGFVHRDVHSLAGSTSGHQGKRTCEDFCKTLQVAVKEMNPLHRLAHETIPEFLYRIRAPFLFCLVTLWLTAALYIAHSLLYRMDVLRIRSHLLTTRASHLVDVKALLTKGRKMLSLYKDVDYFDDDFHSQPAAIGKAVEQIKAQLGKLRGKLKNTNKDDAIKRLTDLKSFGLGDSEWILKDPTWNGTDSLKAIQNRVKFQNEQLGKQPEIITDAIEVIRGELSKVRIDMNNVFNTEDVVDLLQRLQRKIGHGGHAGLQGISYAIKNLREGPFTRNPDDIHKANEAIKGELTTLQNELQGAKPGSDVIKSLDDLKDTGLSGKDKWNGDKKGLSKIDTELQGQQNTLSSQPGVIEGGVQDIISELTKLQKQLSEQVTDKLQKLREHGLNNGGNNWTEDKTNVNGIQKITEDIETIKTRDVDNVKHHLIALCSAVRHNARDLRDILKDVKENLVGELTKIKDKFSDLLSEQVRPVIAEVRGFVKFLDNGKAQLIRELHAFVNKEVKAAEETLIREARRQCVSNIKELLKLFARKVEEELNPLPPLITEDLQMGYKGFMYDFQQRFVTHISPLKGALQLEALSTGFKRFQLALSGYISAEIRRVHSEESKKKNPVPQEPETLYTDKLVRVTLSLNALLEYIRTEDTFDHRLQALLRSLTDALSHLKPESFARPSSPVLDGLVEGLTKFAAEFTCAYVSTYAGAQFTADLLKHETLTETVRSQGTKSVTVRNVTKLTPYGAMCAKVFLTMLPTLCDALRRLWEQCGKDGSWRDLNINSSSNLGTFLHRSGYRVATSPSDQDGELRDDCNGHDVYVLVSQNITDTENNAHLQKCLSLRHACNLLDLLQCLCTHLHQYYRTCHLKVHPSPRPPCSIYEMLTWCCGLPHNAVYLGLNSEALPLLFEAEEPDSWDSDVPLMNLSSLALKAHPRDITPASLTDALTEVCHRSHSVLTTLLGYGHADGIYACDFNTNPGGLLYPGDADALLCLLFDVLRRLHHQLYFLYRRCLYNARHGGWLDCWYGRDVGGSSWKCNTMQCANQMCDQQCNQTHNQICNQRCDQHPKCGVKSPLQSFLEDGLVGFLPHQLSADGTCVKCSGCDTKSPGLPCKTPMGLSNITRLASRASQGRHIMDVLGALCGGASSPLARLCGYLTCLLTRPPRTPDDLFAFYYNFICEWRSSGEHRKAAFEDAVGDACFRQRGVTLDVSTIFRTSNHGSVPEMPHLTGDLFSLVKCNGTPRSAPSHPCGPYLKPLGHDVRATFSKAHAHLYLSWVVYLTETFYDFLQELLRDCERNCADATSTCHARSCDNQCQAKRRPLAPSSNHTADCPSIADCDSTTPTLFRYGFALRDVHSLAGSTSGQQSKRTCEDFCTALQVAVKELNPLHKLAHETIPEYLYRIRAPFLFAIIALWLTAALYIAHSLLYRMDVLRIRSHLLTTRASHLIDVKALLAGSRRMLSLYKDVDYFDEDLNS